MSVMSVRLPSEIEQQLMQLAEATNRKKSWLVTQAIQDYLERESWQVKEIEQALMEADAEDFASEDEMLKKFKSWGVNAN